DWVGPRLGRGIKGAPQPALRATFSPRAGRREWSRRSRRGPTTPAASREAGVWTAGGMDAPAACRHTDVPHAAGHTPASRARQDAQPPRRKHKADNGAMEIREISPAEALARVQAGAVLVDVRREDERLLGMADCAIGVVREELESAPDTHLPDHDAEILLICQGGRRSMMAA